MVNEWMLGKFLFVYFDAFSDQGAKIAGIVTKIFHF